MERMVLCLDKTYFFMESVSEIVIPHHPRRITWRSKLNLFRKLLIFKMNECSHILGDQVTAFILWLHKDHKHTRRPTREEIDA